MEFFPDHQMAPLSPCYRAIIDFAVKVLTDSEHITDADWQAQRKAHSPLSVPSNSFDASVRYRCRRCDKEDYCVSHEMQ